MALMIVISVVYTFSALGTPHANYISSVERIKMADCQTVKAAADKHRVIVCLKEKPNG